MYGKKRLACAIMSAVLSSVLLTSCGQKEKAADGQAVKLKYWVGIDTNAASIIKNYGELEMYKEIEKRTGVEIEFKHPPMGQEVQQFNLMIAARDLPDIIEYNWLSYPGGPTKAISDGILIKLNDTIDKYAPNLKKIIDTNDVVRKQVMTDDGSLYVFPALALDTYKTFGGLFLRKDWLDELGLAVPETVSEWETVLKAFKEKKGAEAPFTNIKEYLSGTSSNMIFCSAFNIAPQFYVDNGKVKYGPMEPNYKQYLALLRSWYKEGLIDADIVSNDTKMVDAKMVNGKSAASYGALGAKFGKYMTLAREKGDKGYTLVAAPPMVMNKGDKPVFVSRGNEYDGVSSAGITSVNKHPEAAAKVLDYFYGQEGTMLKNFGIEGLTYNNVEGFPKYTDMILKNPDGLAVAQSMAKHFRANSPSPGLNSDNRYLEQYYTFQEQKDAIKLWNKDADNALSVQFPLQVSYAQDEASEMASIMGEINTYQNEIFIKFLMGAEPVENFDKHVQKLRELKIDKILEIKQKAYERYLNRK